MVKKLEKNSKVFAVPDILKEIKFSWQCHDYKNAIFLCSNILGLNQSFYLLYAILHYYAGEWSQCLKYCQMAGNTMTCCLYKVLAYKQLKMYSEAKHLLEANLVNDMLIKENFAAFGSLSSIFLLQDDDNRSYLYKMVGDLDLLNESCDQSYGSYVPVLSLTKHSYYDIYDYLINERFLKSAYIDGNRMVVFTFHDGLKITKEHCLVTDFFYNLLSNKEDKVISYINNREILGFFLQYFHSYYFKNYFSFNYDGVDLINEMISDESNYSMNGLVEHCNYYWKTDFTEGVEFIAYKFIKKCPNDFRTWIILGIYYIMEKSYGVSIKCLFKSISIHKSYHAYSYLAYIYEKKEIYSKAKHYYTKSNNMLKSSIPTYLGLANMHFMRCENTLAKINFEKAIQLDQKNKDSLLHYIRFCISSSNYKIAFSLFISYLEPRIDTVDEIYQKLVIEGKMSSKIDELLALEFAELIFKSKNLKEMALEIFNSVKFKDSNYYSKRCLLFEESK